MDWNDQWERISRTMASTEVHSYQHQARLEGAATSGNPVRLTGEVASALIVSRPALVRRGLRLTYITLGYNCLEGLIATGAGLVAGSIALVGFGLDSSIEVSASAAALWRLYSDCDAVRRARAERLTIRVIGALFLVLAGYVALDAIHTLTARAAPDTSVVGIVLATLSLGVMPLLARAKRRVAFALGSGALAAEATQTALCTYLSAILLAGLLLNLTVGWWWADPVAALVMVPFIAKEGMDGLRGRSACGDCCP